MFCHATGQKAASSGLNNFCNYFTKVYESRYVSGVVAGMKLKELMDSARSPTLYRLCGRISLRRGGVRYTAFFLGIQSFVPKRIWTSCLQTPGLILRLKPRPPMPLFPRLRHDRPARRLLRRSLRRRDALKGGKTVYAVGYNVDMLSVAPTAALTSSRTTGASLYRAHTHCPGWRYLQDGLFRRLRGERRYDLEAGRQLRRRHRRQSQGGRGRHHRRKPACV